MEISATVPRRGDVITFAHPTFWSEGKVNNLREFYGVGRQDAVGYSPFRAGAVEAASARPWMGMRVGNNFSPASSVCSATHCTQRPPTAAPTDVSYPQTAATSRPRTSQPEVQIIKHVHVDQNTITEERVAMQKLQTENEELRKMCGELQRVIDNTVQMAQNVSEDSKNVAQLAHQLAEMRLLGHDAEHAWQDRLLLDDDKLSVESSDGAEEADGPGQRLQGVHKHTPDVLRIEATPSTGKKLALESAETSKRGFAEGSARPSKPPTPRGTPLQTPRGGLHTARDNLRPGTASFSPRLMTPRNLGTPRKPPTPRGLGGPGAAQEATRPGTVHSRPGTAGAHPAANSGHAGAGEHQSSRPPTAQSTASERMKRQRPIHSGRTYIALYRDAMLGTVEDFSRLVFPKEDAKRDQFLKSMNKQQGDRKKASTARLASGDGASKTRPLSEMVDRKSWDGFDWKEPPKDPKAPYDGWPGIRRQVHWEPPRGGGAGHSAPIEWSKLVLNKPGGKIYQAAMPIVGAKARPN
eukprot:Tamp_13831.p1 GENE.Tamp_13831~~Tamp_13831.p1  ORF type:complete len:534 (+),score=78.47 Tamp_13831:34-1602(+)